MSVTEHKYMYISTQESVFVTAMVFMGYIWNTWYLQERKKGKLREKAREQWRKRRKSPPLLLDNWTGCLFASRVSISSKDQRLSERGIAAESGTDSKRVRNRKKPSQVRFSDSFEIMSFDGEKRITKRQGEVIRGILRDSKITQSRDVEKSVSHSCSAYEGYDRSNEKNDSMERYITLLSQKVDKNIRFELDGLRTELQQIRKVISSLLEKEVNRSPLEGNRKQKLVEGDKYNPSMPSVKRDLFLSASSMSVTSIDKMSIVNEEVPIRSVSCLSNHLGAIRKIALAPTTCCYSTLDKNCIGFVTASEDCTLKLWKLETSLATDSSSSLENDIWSSSSNVVHPSKLGKDAKVKGETLHTYRGHLAPVLSVQIFPDIISNGRNGLLVSGDAQGTLIFWDLPSDGETHTYMSHHNLFPFQRHIVTAIHNKECIWDICKPLSDAPLMATAGGDGMIKLWDYSSFRWNDECNSPMHKYANMEPLGVIPLTTQEGNVLGHALQNNPTTFAVSSHEALKGSLLVGSVMDTLYSIDLKERKIVNQWSLDNTHHVSSHQQEAIYAIEIVPESTMTLLGTSIGNIFFQDMRMEEPIQAIGNGAGTEASVTCIQSSTNNKCWLACGGSKGLIRFWDIRRTDSCLGEMNLCRKAMESCCIWSLLTVHTLDCLIVGTSQGYSFICSP
eukprot:jgi/Galph1/4087/GphlegSOOS_G2750.1